ncbi:putative transporter ywbf, partial [Globisporangium polare]
MGLLRLGFLVDGGEAKALVPLKMLFLIHLAAFSVQTYLPIYFDATEHFSKMQIGVLLSIP